MSKLNIIHPNPVKRAEAMHNQQTSAEWNNAHLEAAKNQFQNPISGLLGSVRDRVKGFLKGTVKLGTDLITHPIAAVANYSQLAWDIVTKAPSRVALAASDTVSKGIFGRISRLARSSKEKVHNAMDSTSSPVKPIDPK